MKLIVNRNQLDGNPEQFLRRAGYGYFRDRRSGKESFSRRLGSGVFPKLHMYVDEHDNQIIFDLHLDQKQPSYGGSRMHNAEHDGEVVENEIKRLRSLVAEKENADSSDEKVGDLVDSIGGNRSYDKNIEVNKKKSWWKRLFM